MRKFLVSQELIESRQLKWARLEEAMSKNSRARKIMSLHTWDSYESCLKEINSWFGSSHRAFLAIAENIAKLPLQITTENDYFQLHFEIRRFKAYLELWQDLKVYASTKWFVQSILMRLSVDHRQIFLEKHRAFEQVNYEIPFVEFAFQHWSPAELRSMRTLSNLLEMGRYDISSGRMLQERQAIYGNPKQRDTRGLYSDKGPSSSTNFTKTSSKTKKENADKKGPKKPVSTNAGDFQKGPGQNTTKSSGTGPKRVNTTNQNKTAVKHADGQRSKKQQGPSIGASSTKHFKAKTTQKRKQKTGGRRKGGHSSYSCEVCKNESCTTSSPFQCSQYYDALASTNKQLKEDTFKKIYESGFCPVCRAAVSNDGNHKCPPSVKLTDKSGNSKIVETSAFQCPAGCLFRARNAVIVMSKFLCRCGRSKNKTGTFRTSNCSRVIDIQRIADAKSRDDMDNSTGKDKVAVHWEEMVKIRDLGGKDQFVILSLDSCSDHSLVNSRTFSKFARDSSETSFALQTATSRKQIKSREGVIDIRLYSGELYPVAVLEIPAADQANVLNRERMACVEIDEETQRHVNMEHRAMVTPYHILVGQNAIKLIPEKVLHRSKDGCGEVRESRVNDKKSGVLGGTWHRILSAITKLTSYSIDIKTCMETVTEKMMEDDGEAIISKKLINDKEPPILCKKLPVPIGPLPSNQMMTRSVASRIIAPHDRGMLEDDPTNYWYPRLPNDSLYGDRCTGFIVSPGVKEIPSILRHDGKCPSCKKCEKLKAGLKGDCELKIDNFSELQGEKQVSFAKFSNEIIIPKFLELSVVYTGGEVGASIEDFKKRRKQMKALFREVIKAGADDKKLALIRQRDEKVRQAHEDISNPKLAKWRGHLTKALQEQEKLKKIAEGGEESTYLIPSENPEEIEDPRDGVEKTLPKNLEDPPFLWEEMDENGYKNVCHLVNSKCPQMDWLDFGYTVADLPTKKLTRAGSISLRPQGICRIYKREIFK